MGEVVDNKKFKILFLEDFFKIIINSIYTKKIIIKHGKNCP